MKLNKSYLGILLVFVAGIALGAVGSRFVRFHCFGPPRWEEGRPPGPPTQDMLLDRFSRDLHLSAEQIEKIKIPVYEMHNKMEALRMEHAPQIKEVIDDMVQKVSPLLNPDQKKNLEELISRFRHGPEGSGKRFQPPHEH